MFPVNNDLKKGRFFIAIALQLCFRVRN